MTIYTYQDGTVYSTEKNKRIPLMVPNANNLVEKPENNEVILLQFAVMK